MFGNSPAPQSEETPFDPCSPYAAAKLYAHSMVKIYRERGLFASSGILFNHESPLRGENFVTRKISRAVAQIALGKQEVLNLGNLNAVRDWGHAKDYVKAMHMILQADKPDEFVIAAGTATTVREFATMAFQHIGLELAFEGEGVQEVGKISSIDTEKFLAATGLKTATLREGQTVIKVLEEFFRPCEVHHLCGDASKAEKILGWRPETTLQELVSEMVESDLQLFSGKRPARLLEEMHEMHREGVYGHQ